MKYKLTWYFRTRKRLEVPQNPKILKYEKIFENTNKYLKNMQIPKKASKVDHKADLRNQYL